MTRKIYYEDPYIREFSTSITAVEEKDGEYHIELDQTAFYPEGGGQPCDLGQIGEQAVTYVYEDEERIFHVTDKLPDKTEELIGKVNWERRIEELQ
jgi:alanyl-tRNA synthetase